MTCGSCGNDMRLTTDLALKFQWDTTEDLICWACVVREVRRRVLGEKAKNLDKNAGLEKPHYFDGRELLVSLLDPSALEVTG